ncbi:COG4420 Predicted membrane protein [Rhabdaerophilaceae bacterium]
MPIKVYGKQGGAQSSAMAMGSRKGAARRKGRCALTGVEILADKLISLGALRPMLQELILGDHPNLDPDSTIGIDEVDRYRQIYVEKLIRSEAGDLTRLEREVAESLALNGTISENIEDNFSAERSLGELWADRLAAYGSSWGFMLGFIGLLLVWIVMNLWMGGSKAFDPYPFILLNLVLSCLAALQAPIIMMSQRRQEAKDRLRSQSDYQVNVKAELEIRHLHEKMDHLQNNQWQRLSEIQRLQIEMLQQRR